MSSALSGFATPAVSSPAPSQARPWPIFLRCALFVFVLFLVCPIRYFNLEPSIDNTWVYLLNYAAAHGISGVIWTTGPLAFLSFPQDIGDNLNRGLTFQLCAWLVLAAVFADLFFLAGYRLRNLAAFTAFFALSTPLYWFNYTGLENLIVASVLILLISARWRGGNGRYVAALLLTGFVPLIKLPAVIVAGGAVAGYLAEALYRRRPGAARDLALALAVPSLLYLSALRILLHSVGAVGQYLHGSFDTAANYSVAMAVRGDPMEFAAVAEIMAWMAVLLYFAGKANHPLVRFTIALLAIPLCLNFKHSFVRQDIHVINFFCFAALALASIALMMSIERPRVGAVGLILLAYGIIWIEYNVEHFANIDPLRQATAVTPFRFASHALWFKDVRPILRAETEASFGPGTRFEPEIVAAIGKSPVAALGTVFNAAQLDGLNLQLYPVIKRDGAYTPYLDNLNAAWIRDRGPRYLIADWESIDQRQLWAETPAMWLEIYRWYDTRLLARRSLLLERRAAPRFQSLQVESRFDARPAEGFAIPDSDSAVFWSMNCRMTAAGAVEKLLFRIPEVLMTVDGNAPQRVIPEVLASPVMGNFLPENLREMGDLFTPGASAHTVKKFAFGGPGIGAYAATCPVEFWTTR